MLKEEYMLFHKCNASANSEGYGKTVQRHGLPEPLELVIVSSAHSNCSSSVVIVDNCNDLILSFWTDRSG